MRITLFLPCFNDALFPRTGVATVRVLERLGKKVDFPPDQTCCGQIHFNTGFRREATRLMERFLRVFARAEVVVAPSASCVAMVREQYPELASAAGGGRLADSVREVGEKTFELTEFLVEVLGIVDVGACFPHSVTYHPTCHSTRSIDVGDAPTRLLRAVDGLTLVELGNPADCCGFGGTFSVKNAHTSLAMMEDKIQAVERSGAQVLTAVDNSCLMHLSGGMRRKGILAESSISVGVAEDPEAGLQVMHLAEILAQATGVQG